MRDGTIIKPVDEVKYLGCQLNNKADGIKEVKKRIADCMVVLKKLDLFWRHGNASLRRKIQVQEAVINTKLMYGLESLQLPTTAYKKMDVVQLEGLRKLLKMDTTFVHRTNTNEEVFRRVNAALEVGGVGQKGPYTRLSERHLESKRRLFAVLMDAGEGDPRAEVAFDTATLKPHNHGKRRVGHPRKNWVVETAREIWSKRVREEHGATAVGDLDLNNEGHREMMKHTATVDAQEFRLLRMARKRG